MKWLRLHAIAAPFGVFVVTLLLLERSGQWGGWERLEAAASLVDLAVVIYGMFAVLAERGVDMVFWALEQRQKRRAKIEAEARAVGRAVGRVEGFAEGRVEGHAEGRAEGRAEGHAEGLAEERKRQKARMALISQQTGIPLEDLLPPEDDST